MSVFRAGVRPNDPAKGRLRLGNYLSGPIVPPPSADWDRRVRSFPMDANDQWGDCVWAMIGHTIQTWTANASTEIVPPVSALLKGYSDVTGFDPKAGPPGNNPTDQGTVLQDAFDYWRKVGVAGHFIVAFAEVDITNTAELEAAVALFGELLIAVDFPDTAMDQFNQGKPWDVVPGAQSEGGHAICSAKYDHNSSTPWTIITWGKEQKVTTAWMRKYLREAWIAISPEWISANGTSPSGLDLHGLGADLAILTGQPNPFPPDGPTPPVTPPGPPSFPAALVQAVADLAADPAVVSWLRSRHLGKAAAVAKRLAAVLEAPRS